MAYITDEELKNLQVIQKDITYRFYDTDYQIHLTMSNMGDGLFRTSYHFKFTPEDERKTIFYCVTSDSPEVVFSYIIDAYRTYGPAEWKKHLTFDFVSKKLFYDEKEMPV